MKGVSGKGDKSMKATSKVVLEISDMGNGLRGGFAMGDPSRTELGRRCCNSPGATGAWDGGDGKTSQTYAFTQQTQLIEHLICAQHCTVPRGTEMDRTY